MKNDFFERDIEGVPDVFQKLSIISINSERYLKGELDIIDSSGKIWESYQVEIRGSQDYPKAFPKLFEVGNAFPKIAEWHVYTDDGSCCCDVTPNELLLCKNGLHVLNFIQQFAIPYFANQKHRELEGYYLYGEYSHGILGRIEFYQNKLKAKSPVELIRMLELIIPGFYPGRTEYCPFCHKVKFRKCHRDVFKELASIRTFINYDLQILKPFFLVNPSLLI
ncbi:MAG: hypothetical protein WAZ98_08770 [Cyclobacteriaceae bacterium]